MEPDDLKNGPNFTSDGAQSALDPSDLGQTTITLKGLRCRVFKWLSARNLEPYSRSPGFKPWSSDTLRDKNAYFHGHLRRNLAPRRRPGKSSEIPVEMPSKDLTSESFRVNLPLPWGCLGSRVLSEPSDAKNRVHSPAGPARNQRLLLTSRVHPSTFGAHRRRHFAKTSPQTSSGISEVSLFALKVTALPAPWWEYARCWFSRRIRDFG